MVQPWSTLPGMLKIELFYFMILPVGGTLIDLALSMKARLEIYTNGHGTSICDNYNKCSPKKPWKNAPCGGRVPLVTTWNYIDVTASQKMITKNKTKWELSTLVSRRSLDEWNASTWHHDVDITKLFLVLQAAPEEHNVIRMLYGERDLCLSTPVLYKISTKANIQMVNMVERLCT